MVSQLITFICIVYAIYADNHQSTYYKQWCSDNAKKPGYCKYLDDTGCNKYFPASYDQEFMCPNRYDSSHLTGYKPTSSFNNIVVNETAIKPLVNPNFRVSVIMIRRDSNNKPYYKYFGLNQALVYQPWSSSKCFAIINAASTQRQDCNLGLNSYEDNKKDELGDLATIVHSYGSNQQGLESNCLAYYFLDIGGRQQLDDNIHSKWLDASSSDSLGGNYGCEDTYGLSYSFTEINNITNKCSVPNSRSETITNSLSALAASEMYKRIVMTREEPEYKYPDTEWTDVKQLMYGPLNSTMFPGIMWGGGTTDTAWYVQSGLTNISAIDENTKGNWRIFSKLGAGNTDIVYNSYSCLPQYDGDNVVENGGVEFVISLRYTSSASLCYTDTLVHQNLQPIIQAIMDGTIS